MARLWILQYFEFSDVLNIGKKGDDAKGFDLNNWKDGLGLGVRVEIDQEFHFGHIRFSF